MSRANAALEIFLKTGERPKKYHGTTGGNHIIETKSGRFYSVDLVINKVSLCVGLLPAYWAHPPTI